MLLIKLLLSSKRESSEMVQPLVSKVYNEITDADRRESVIELVEGTLMRLFPEKSYEEVHAMVLHDIRKSKAWQEMQQEARRVGLEEGRQEGRQEAKEEIAKRLLAESRSLQEIADILGVSIADARKWSRN